MASVDQAHEDSKLPNEVILKVEPLTWPTAAEVHSILQTLSEFDVQLRAHVTQQQRDIRTSFTSKVVETSNTAEDCHIYSFPGLAAPLKAVFEADCNAVQRNAMSLSNLERPSDIGLNLVGSSQPLEQLRMYPLPQEEIILQQRITSLLEWQGTATDAVMPFTEMIETLVNGEIDLNFNIEH